MWDPTTYLAFADHRGRPFYEMVNRIGATAPRRVVDLGCGPGNLTVDLARRWPDAELAAIDSSPEMVDAARARGLDARVADVTEWRPGPDTDVVVTNAVLQWVPGHPELLRTWIAELPAWRDRLAGAFSRSTDPVLTAAGYANLLADAGCAVDAWETTYVQPLTGDDPVLAWVSGTALRPARAALDDQEWERFRADLAPLLRAAYPTRPDGVTWFEFRRVFAVAHKR
jgi:trans-aconitate 2-methyltransferase